MIRLGFEQRFGPNKVEGGVFGGHDPSFFGGSMFGLDDLIHHELPGARGHGRITGGQVGFGDLKVDGRLLEGFVFGVNNSLSFSLIVGVEALALAGSVVPKVEDAVSSIEAIPSFHRQ
jgi:hypothetical protein